MKQDPPEKHCRAADVYVPLKEGVDAGCEAGNLVGECWEIWDEDLGERVGGKGLEMDGCGGGNGGWKEGEEEWREVGC